MANGIVLCVASHPVDLDDGRTLGPGESADGVDVSHAHNQLLLDEGLVIELDTLPKDTPRKDEDETPPPAEVPAVASTDNQAAPPATGGNG